MRLTDYQHLESIRKQATIFTDPTYPPFKSSAK
jgi:hypothetical protein